MSVEPATNPDEPIDAGSFEYTTSQPLKRVPPKVAPRQAARNEKLETLEDLYAAYPSIGDGASFLRITRTAPRNYNQMPISGFLCDLNDKLSMSAFAEQFGGGRYDVAVIGPSGPVDAEGNQPSRQLASIDIGIQGLPIVGGIGDDMQQQQPIRAGNYVGNEHPTVATKRMAFEHEDRMYERQERAKATQTPEHVVKALTEQSREAIAGVKEQATFNNTILRDQNDAYLKQIVQQAAEIKELGAKHMEFQVKAGENLRTAETTIAARLTAAHEQALKTLTETHRAEITSLKETYGKDREEKALRAISELSSVKDAHNKEMSDLRGAHNSALSELRSSHASMLSELRATQAAALASEAARYQGDLARLREDDKRIRDASAEAHTARLADAKSAYEREVNNIRSNHNTTSEFVKANAENKIESQKEEMNRMRMRCETLERDNEKLRKEANVDPMTYLMNAEKVASSMLGMVRPSDIEQPEKEEAFDWKKELAKAAMGMAAKLPETAERVAAGMASVRERNAQIHAQAEAQAGQAQGPRGRGRRQQVLAQAPWASAPPAHLGPVVAEVAYQAPLPPIRREGVPGFAPQTAAAPQAPLQGEGPVAQPPAPAPVAAAQPQATPAAAAEVPAEQLEGFMRFVEELENAIKGEMVPPALFAKGLVDQIGVEQAAQFLAQTSVEGFFAHIESVIGDNTTPILEKAGRDYTKAVWAAVTKIVAAATGTT